MSKDFYTQYYQAASASRANAEYCQRVYGINLCQHGFAELEHLQRLAAETGIAPHSRVLDMGCGNGMIAEYLAAQTGAHFTGIDFIPEAILQAQERTRSQRECLSFILMDIAAFDFPPESFDVILAIDSLYFTPLVPTLQKMLGALKPGGRIGAFYNQSWQPWTPLQDFPLDQVHPDRSELAQALQTLGLPYQVWDYTPADIEHARRRLRALADLHTQFEAEGNMFLYQNHLDEATGVLKASQSQAHGRYLYVFGKEQGG